MRSLLLVTVLIFLFSCGTTPSNASFQEVSYEVGLPLIVTTFYPNNDVSGIIKNQYDEKGRLILQESFDGNGLLVERKTGAVRENVWRLTVYGPLSGNPVSYQDLVYSSSGDLVLETFLDVREEPLSSNEYLYQDELKREWLAKTGAGGLQARTVYHYDNKGNVLLVQVYDSAGNLTNTFENSYSEEGILQSRNGTNALKQSIELINFFWEQGVKVKEEIIKPIPKTIEYEYEQGRDLPSGITMFVRDKIVEKQTIEYLWLKKTKRVSL